MQLSTDPPKAAQPIRLELIGSTDCLTCQACYSRGELDRVPQTETYACPLGAVVTSDTANDVLTDTLVAFRAHPPCGKRLWESAKSGSYFTYLVSSNVL